MGAPSAVRVVVPATSANLGPGFDALGLALALYDEVEVGLAPDVDDVRVEVVGECADDVPRDRTHLVARAVALGGSEEPAGLWLRCVNRLPHGRGLGSSAAAIVAGILAGRSLLAGEPRDDAAILALAAEMEGHPDNVAATLLGGATIAWTDGGGRAHAVRIDVHPGLVAVAFVPPVPVATRTARALLPDLVPHPDAAANAARAALLVEALGRRPDLLLEATADRLHQSYRAPAMPESAALVGRLRSDGVAAVISGAGPTVVALTDRATSGSLAAVAPSGWRALVLEVDRVGATIESI